MSASVGSTNISFKTAGQGPGGSGNSLLAALAAGGYSGAANPGTTNISLADFYGANFSDGSSPSSAPSSGNQISVSDFVNRTMGSSGGGSGKGKGGGSGA